MKECMSEREVRGNELELETREYMDREKLRSVC